MDIDSLKAFTAVAQQESFTRASDQLYLSQSAISKRISHFESMLGVKLFDRIGHQVRLTEAGRLLLPRAEKILLDIEDCQREIKNLNQTVSGSLKIGTSHHIGLHRLPEVLKNFKSQFPAVELHIEFQDSEEACTAVEKGQIELGVVTLPTRQNTGSTTLLQTETIWVDQLLPVIHKDHELLSKKKLSIKQIAEVDAILPAENTFTRTLLEGVLEKAGVHLQTSMATNYLETIKMLVSVGLGWSVLPKTMIDKELTVLPIREFEIKRPLGIVTHPEHSLSNAAKALIEILRSLAES